MLPILFFVSMHWFEDICYLLKKLIYEKRLITKQGDLLATH